MAAPPGQEKCLGPSGAGMCDASGEPTQTCLDTFVNDVIEVCQLSSAGTAVVGAVASGNPIFAFAAIPAASVTLMKPTLLDPEKPYQKLIVQGIYAPLIKMLNVPGAIPLFPIFDPTSIMDLPTIGPITLDGIPQLLIKLCIQFALAAVPLTLPKAQLSFHTDFGIDTKLGGLAGLLALIIPPVPPSLPIPPIPIPPIPQVPFPNAGISAPSLPSIGYPALALGIFKMPIVLLPQLITLITSPVIDPVSLIEKIIKLILDLMIALLKELGLILGTPVLLLATIAVIARNLAVMLLIVVVSNVLGTGALCEIIASLPAPLGPLV